ncbi:trehalose-phosphatase [bacterium]|nr:trehalose-phosphatase [bacterium]
MTSDNPGPSHVFKDRNFWQNVRLVRHKLLAIDYDGTLAPFCIDRMTAFPLPGIMDTLLNIRDTKHTSIAIISGRPVNEILFLMGEINVDIVGSHGAEIRRHDGTIWTFHPGSKQKNMLKQSEEQALSILSEFHEARIERKLNSIAVHTRGMKPDRAEFVEKQIFSVWVRNLQEDGMECRRFNGGIELRCKGINKGTGISNLLRDQSPDLFCVYIGDDDTDEDAFKVIEGRCGTGIKVGLPTSKTLASRCLQDVQEVSRFLIEWCNVTINDR